MLKHCIAGLAVCLLVLTGVNAWALDFTYTESGGEITITEYIGPGGDVVIPATIDGLPVVSIGDQAFYQSESLISVVIPDSVISIGNSAFQYCFALISVSLPNSITSIGESTFNNCSALAAIDIPGSVTSIGDTAFSGCSALTAVTIPDSVASIGNGAFSLCDSLSAVYFSGNAPSLGILAFANTAPDFAICYTPAATGFDTPFWEGYPASACACSDDTDCAGDEICRDSICTVPDDPPVIENGPFLAAGTWPVLPTSPSDPIHLKLNASFLWMFSDDYASCSETCTHAAEYQALGESTWTALTVNVDPTGESYAYADLPISHLPNKTAYAFRFAVIDCASQSTDSEQYYFKTARGIDYPPEITAGPFVAAGTWPELPRWWESDDAPVLTQNVDALWTFEDDYLSCSGLCTQRARYRKDDGDPEKANWVWTALAVSTDPTGKEYAYAELPVESLDAGTYWFWFDVQDCTGERVYSKVHTFKVSQ